MDKAKKDDFQIDKFFVELKQKLSSPQVVQQLCAPDVTEYERGKHAGKIEMYNYIRKALGVENEANKV